jgi:hypothetical protein
MNQARVNAQTLANNTKTSAFVIGRFSRSTGKQLGLELWQDFDTMKDFKTKTQTFKTLTVIQPEQPKKISILEVYKQYPAIEEFLLFEELDSTAYISCFPNKLTMTCYYFEAREFTPETLNVWCEEKMLSPEWRSRVNFIPSDFKF